MSQASDDKSFEDYLSGDSEVSKRYGALDADDVPAELDRRVLAQAHAAVKRSSGKPAWMKWSAPLALAASVVLVVSVVFESGTRHQVDRTGMLTTAPQSPIPPNQEIVVDASSGRQVAPAVQGQVAESASMETELRQNAAAEREITVTAAKRAPAASAANEPQQASAAQPAAVTEPPSVSVTASMRDKAGTESGESGDASRAVGISANVLEAPSITPEISAPRAPELARADIDPASNRAFSLEQAAGAASDARKRDAAVRPAAIGSDAARAQARLTREKDPKVWLEYIRQLRVHDGGELADAEWQRFRKTYPDFKVDDTDLARPRR